MLKAAAVVVTNLGNHVACIFFPGTLRWIRLQLSDCAYFAALPSKLLRRWAALLCKVVITNDSSVCELLSNYKGLAQPADVLWMMNALVSNMQQQIGACACAWPIDADALRKDPLSLPQVAALCPQEL